MQNDATKKTRWARSQVKYRWWAIAGVLLTLLSIGVIYFLLQVQGGSQTTIQLSGHSYKALIRQNEEDRQRGLSGTSNLPTDQAMLFVFTTDSKWGFWMKDMNYPIDMVWLDNNKNVVYTVKNAQPSSYPDTIFKPNRISRYVIELASGTIERTGISIGDKAVLPSGLSPS